MHEAHHHGTLTNSGGTPLGRARADVAGCIDPGNARFEQTVNPSVGARQHKALLVARHNVVQPVGAGSRTEEEE